MNAPDSAREVDESLGLEHGLTSDEYRTIVDRLGRAPSIEELGIFSVMWSEHCSYKSSKPELAKLPTSGQRVLQGPGENAGAVDIGNGMATVFKIESHNHPSYIEPYQGAATGVGGILRDVFTMGARPVANLNSLRFGSAGHPLTPHLLSGVVSGIGGYGNSVGVPTVGGEVHFDPGYDGNILVNAFTLGTVRADRIFRARASGPGNPVLYVGSKTGRDGIHGASLLASAEFKEESEQMRPTVQVGDPFTENLLIEACLETLAGHDVVAIQDMGAAGLTSSSVEMAARGGVGINLDLDRIPLRDQTLSAYEMLLSESQERMLLVARKGREEELARNFERWGLDCVSVGEVTADGLFRASHRGVEVAAIPIDAVDACPPPARPAAKAGRSSDQLDDIADLDDPGATLERLLASPNLCSRGWVYRQYDSFVGANTRIQPGGDAAVVRVRETGAGLAMTTDCNSRWVSIDPRAGTAHAVAEAVRNLAATGARPLAVSDCLNFGSPEKPEVMWQFTESVAGMAEACTIFDAPVISGNVSFYNDTRGASIPPTPVIAMVGLIDDVRQTVGAGLPEPGLDLLLLGEGEPVLSASEYLSVVHGRTGSELAAIDLAAERRTAELLASLIGKGLVVAAHDISDGGLATALAEMALVGDAGGLDVTVPVPDRADRALFGECGCRFLLAAAPSARAAIETECERSGVPVLGLGKSGGSRVVIRQARASGQAGTTLADLDTSDLARGWQQALGKIATA